MTLDVDDVSSRWQRSISSDTPSAFPTISDRNQARVIVNQRGTGNSLFDTIVRRHRPGAA
jgi:hypothetical protein